MQETRMVARYWSIIPDLGIAMASCEDKFSKSKGINA
jgi:hypothetical protein